MPLTHSIQRRITAYRNRRRAVQTKINVLAFCRGVVFLILVVGVSLCFGGDYVVYGVTVSLSASAVFLYLMVLHDRCYRYRTQCDYLIRFSQDDLARAEYRFKDVEYQNPILFEDTHPFAHDLDLSGAFSLLKAIDNSVHSRSKAMLRAWLDRASTVEEVLERQAAVADLTGRKRFRLRLSLAAAMDSDPSLAADDLDQWRQLPVPWTLKLGPYLFGRALSLLSTSALVLHFFFQIDVLPWLPLLLANLAVFYGFDLAHKRFNLLFMERGKALAAACSVIGVFEKINFQAPLLQRLQQGLSVDGRRAGKNLTRLLGLYERLQYRSNGFAHFFLNGLLLWDQHYLRQLSGWRREFGPYLPDWIEAIFKVEALAALANFRWLYPGRPFPELVTGNRIHLEAESLGHPGIADSVRVGNDYRLSGDGKVHLVTGSNMSGKSTFLRTVGLNLVLARMGAPVCASRFECSLPRIWTSIRIQDSLAEGVSYFYAEVQRLKLILEEIEKDETPVFYLLDEILKGTNSHERLIACKALVGFLIRHRAGGLITTHDLELLALQKEHPESIANYHFRERVQDDEMFFDYKLKPGELTSTNALRVMRFAKIPLDFEE